MSVIETSLHNDARSEKHKKKFQFLYNSSRCGVPH